MTSTGFRGRPQKYQHAPTPRAARLAIVLIHADLGILMIARRNTIQMSAAMQSVRETCKWREPAIWAIGAAIASTGSSTLLACDFLLAPHNAAPTTMP